MNAIRPTPVAPPPLPAAARERSEKVRAASREFESVFLGMAVNEMMKGTMPSVMNGGHGEEMFRSLLGNEIGAAIARNGGIGIAGTVEAAMKAYGK